jgi:hypothetical protein
MQLKLAQFNLLPKSILVKHIFNNFIKQRDVISLIIVDRKTCLTTNTIASLRIN